MNNSYEKMISFHDPIFETINFEKEISRVDPTSSLLVEDRRPIFKEIIHTYEMSRLLFLKQAGLNFLVFPSATHNRFAHSIGCWYIGTLALDLIKVNIEDNYVKILKNWLDAHDAIFEFLIALLVHDCGHGPFSHVLESNRHLSFNHEEVAKQLILGRGKIIEVLEDRIKRCRLDDTPCETTISEIIDKYNLNKNLIASLISSSDEEFRKDYPELVPLKDLVSSKVDIDRLDHYYRDSKYFGIKIGELNIKAFLENIVLYPNTPMPTRVKKTGIPYILNLLYSRELIWMTALDNPITRAYETMLNTAVSILVDKGLVNEDIIFYTDDELLELLRTSKVKFVEDMYYRIVHRIPYMLVCEIKVPTNICRKDIDEAIESIKSKRNLKDLDLLAWIPFKDKPKTPIPWLKIWTDDGKELEDIHPGFNIAIWEVDKNRCRTIKIFARNRDILTKIKDDVVNLINY